MCRFEKCPGVVCEEYDFTTGLCCCRARELECVDVAECPEPKRKVKHD